MNKTCKYSDILRNRNLKVTPPRLKLLEAISECNHAISYSEIQKKMNQIDRVTLYRNLNTLIDKGLVHKASLSGDETYYAVCSCNCTSESHKHKHIHFKCTKCKTVSCVHLKKTLDITIPGYQVDTVEIEVNGLCQECLQTNSAYPLSHT